MVLFRALAVCGVFWALGPHELKAQSAAEERALAFLVEEVPRWTRENDCYSCHNNGDAARALYAAADEGRASVLPALADTTSWLARPSDWEHNGGEGTFSDKRLASIQFGYGLVAAFQAGQITDRRPLLAAAERVAGEQSPQGSWEIDAAGNVGSPATYGVTLATTIARRVLAAAGTERFQPQIGRADSWLLAQRPARVMDAAALLMALGDVGQPWSSPTVQHCLDVVRRGESSGGGWGPFVTSPPEPFDTALVLLALAGWDQAETASMMVRGRQFLLDTQLADGSWKETTRPPDAESYAQRISTAGWATWALWRTRQVNVSDG